MAVKRFKQLESKLKRKPELHSNLWHQIDQYQLKGYAHPITQEEITSTPASNIWYLPINVVINPKSRISQLLKGPDLQIPLMQSGSERRGWHLVVI
uniref:Uncharacterized protein n=1 Tax=Anopheles minimus TaxID=112268 RepID=A0A182WAX9_9DIPT